MLEIRVRIEDQEGNFLILSFTDVNVATVFMSFVNNLTGCVSFLEGKG